MSTTEVSSQSTTTTTTTTPSASTHTTYSRAPPILDDTTSYESWKKQVKLWQICCRLDKDQQAPSLVLSLRGKAREAGLELEVDELNSDAGMELLLKQLDGLYLKDENQQLYVCLKKFEQHKRPASQSINDYINEFERLHNKLKHYKLVYPDAAVAYRLLESANLSKEKNELIRTTITKLEYNLVKIQLRKLEDSAVRGEQSEVYSQAHIKEEPLDTFYGSDQRGRSRGRGGSRRSGRSGNRYRGGSRTRGSSSRGRGPCYVCNQYGHLAYECDKNNDREKEDDEEEAMYTESCQNDKIKICL